MTRARSGFVTRTFSSLLAFALAVAPLVGRAADTNRANPSGAGAPAPAAATSAAATPAPCAWVTADANTPPTAPSTLGPSDAPDPLRVRLHDGKAADFETRAKDGFSLALEVPGEGAADGSSAPNACYTIDAHGLAVYYRFHTTLASADRLRDGVPFASGEARLTVVVATADTVPQAGGDPLPRRFVSVAINRYRKCYVRGSDLTAADANACTVDALSSTSATARPQARAGASTSDAASVAATGSGTSASSDPCPDVAPDASAHPAPGSSVAFCGKVTLALGLLERALLPHPSATHLPDTAFRASSSTRAAEPSPLPSMSPNVDVSFRVAADDAVTSCAATRLAPGLRCVPHVVDFVDDAASTFLQGASFGKGGSDAQDAGSSAAGDASSASARLRRTAATSQASNAPKAGNALDVAYDLVHPFTYNLRSSIELRTSDLFDSVTKQTDRYLTESAGQLVSSLAGARTGTASSQLAFDQYDADTLFRTVPSPIRGFGPDGAPRTQSKAFDSSDVLGLKPFDPAHAGSVTYGGKLMWFPDDGVLGFGYFHDRPDGTNAEIFHGDGTFGHVSAGLSEVAVTTQTPSTNKYVTRLSSANTVVGLVERIGGDDPALQAYERLGTVAGGSDRLLALSYLTPLAASVVGPNGATLQFAGLAGYRAIDAGYSPLGTTYDPMTGTRIGFARVAETYTFPRSRGGKPVDAVQETTLSVVRGLDGLTGVPRYASVGVTETVPLLSSRIGTLSLNGTALVSSIAGSVVARQSGSTLVSGPAASTMLNNGSTALNLSLSLANAKASFGEAATHAPECVAPAASSSTRTLSALPAGFLSAAPPVPHCDSPFSHNLTASAQIFSGSFVADGNIAPGSAQASNPGGASIASNGLVRSFVVAFDVCGKRPSALGIEPSFTVKNNISDTESAFVPGTLMEASLDIGPRFGNVGLRVSEKRAFDAPGRLPSGLAGNSFSISLVTRDQFKWTRYAALDACQRSAKTAHDLAAK